MSRIATPKTISSAKEMAQPALNEIEQNLGSVPNLFRIMSNSPQSLKGFLQLTSSLNDGVLPASTRERIAIAVAEVNDCAYCLAAHNYLAKEQVHLSDEEIRINRRGTSLDSKAAASVEFAVTVAKRKGHISKADFLAVRSAGISDAEIIEIIMHVAINSFTNYLNSALQTDIDFPSVDNLLVDTVFKVMALTAREKETPVNLEALVQK